ncbi:hypothetical protein G5C66_03130 [Nocardioides sp. KC13]|uniref:Uncharacterized protein n=1 Tax=Nocardioides turkmenicus TaxID=2711220 RepID=A0A6M1QV75_9ACTN|nr:hypothetical protein [Nocardioides sp. KC13]NGN91734.1 hypothetical protein [Nocardioides sp. KC13]
MMASRRRLALRVSLPLAVAVAASVTGCAALPGQDDEAKQPAESQSWAPTKEADELDPMTPEMQVIALEEFGVAYDVPEKWLVLDSATATDPSEPSVRKAAERLGVAPKAVLGMLTRLESIAISNEPSAGGLVDSISGAGQKGRLGTVEEILPYITSSGAEVDRRRIESVRGNELSVLRIPFRVKHAGRFRHGVILDIYSRYEDRTAIVTVASGSADRASAGADQVVRSLRIFEIEEDLV